MTATDIVNRRAANKVAIRLHRAGLKPVDAAALTPEEQALILADAATPPSVTWHLVIDRLTAWQTPRPTQQRAHEGVNPTRAGRAACREPLR